ncbi:MAG: ASKHA domain-containing protein [Peptococcaceae bacterium]|jgi:uncharacterized 2Fe-2S/4Fe-4S cluster protein (DUF4445 family)|nr:ASKHA domain-containing protein [Peptococcaceae bacterium]MDH7526205.1 ASKHA domain-containing protein [Peptococcaceae bacterium]
MLLRFDFAADKSQVLKALGYQDSGSVPERVLAEVEAAVEEASTFIKPAVVYDEFSFAVDEQQGRLLLPGGLFFSGEHPVGGLKESRFLVLAVSTLGESYQDLLARRVKEPGGFLALLYDAVGTAGLYNVNRRFWQGLAGEYGRRGLGLTRRFSPGENGWALEEQRVFFKLLDTAAAGVILNENCMMVPVKSLTMAYGVVEENTAAADEHTCAGCGFQGCSQRRHRVTVITGGKQQTVWASHGENLFRVLARNGIQLSNACGGNRACGQCQVVLDDSGQVPESEGERRLLREKNAAADARLACFINVTRDMSVRPCREEDNARVVTATGLQVYGTLVPRVKRLAPLHIAPPTAGEATDWLRRLAEAAGVDLEAAPHTLRKLGELQLLEMNGIGCVVRGHELLDLAAAGDRQRVCGLAVDLGTTTLAAYLLDLETGEELGAASALNPQRIYGADVISRIAFSSAGDNNLAELRRLATEEINGLIGRLCDMSGVAPAEIYEAAVVGNTTMLHLFWGVPCLSLARAPFVPAFTAAVCAKAGAAGISINPEGYVLTLPAVSAYLGADALAAAAVCGMVDEEQEMLMLIDIGTNAEIVLGNKNGLLCCSAAAGPAFEGGRITHGTGGVSGAIDHVRLESEEGYSTIDNRDPVGICGSGLIDAVAELLRYGIIDHTGRLKKKEELAGSRGERFLDRLVKHEGQAAFLIDKRSGLVLTQGDIRELQLAKAAVQAGTAVLCREMGITPAQISRVYLAGGFGSSLNVENACRLGLLPPALAAKVVAAGNAAGTGAKASLWQGPFLDVLEQARKRMRCIDLALSPLFQEEFLNSLDF